MKPGTTHETRAKRARRKTWRNALIWAFLFLFTFSVVGGVIAFTVSR
jgi:hypothetical protein